MSSAPFRLFLTSCLLAFIALAPARGSAAASNPHAENITGTILETMNAAGYTYINIDSADGPVWVALAETALKSGDRISVIPGMEMKDFHSNSLDRTFPSIYFSPGLVGTLAPSPDKSPAAAAQNKDSFAAAIAAEQQGAPAQQIQPEIGSGGSMGAIVPFKEIEVEKAEGENGFTVEEIFTRAEELDGKTARIRAQVVKYNANIMGKNWIHLQDGTGDPMQNTHDLVITTSEEVANPGVLTIEGTVAAGKDFGAGYKYVVIVEDASIIK